MKKGFSEATISLTSLTNALTDDWDKPSKSPVIFESSLLNRIVELLQVFFISGGIESPRFFGIARSGSHIFNQVHNCKLCQSIAVSQFFILKRF